MKFTTRTMQIFVSCAILFCMISQIYTKKTHHRVFRSLNRLGHKHRITSKSLLSMRASRSDDDIPDPEVISQITIISGKKGITCPYPSEFAKGECGDTNCDLNDGNGGNYIHMCLTKKKISEFKQEDKLITTIKININNNECGNLKLIDSKIKNSWIGSDDLYICFGQDEDQVPISDITISFSNNPPANCNLELSAGKFLCITRENKAPKLIEFSEIKMSPVDENFKSLNTPETLAEIDNDNGSAKENNTIKRSLIVTTAKSSAWNIENKFGVKVESKFTVKTTAIVGAKVSVSSTFDMNLSHNRGQIKTETENTQIDFSCMAPAGKYYKCRAYVDKYEARIPYQIKRTVTFSDNSVVSKFIQNYFEGVMSSSIKFDRCCYQGCDQKDPICPESRSESSRTNCPTLRDPTIASPTGSDVRTENLPDNLKEVEVITDININNGKTTTCPPGYIGIACPDKPEKICNIDKNKTHLCIKKVKLDKVQSLPINALRVSKLNRDCGPLKLATIPLNTKDVYLCYGHDAAGPLAPIIGVTVVRTEQHFNRVHGKDGWICESVELYTHHHLCYKRDINVPKRIEVKEFVYKTEEMKKQQVGVPKKVKEIIVSSSTVSVTEKSTKKTETSLKIAFDFGLAISLGFTGTFGVVETSATGTASYRQARTSEVKESTEITESNTVECVAPEGKKIKCLTSMIDYKVTMPYTAQLVSYDYLGKEMPALKKQIGGTFESVNSGNVNIRSCCLEGCCLGEPDEATKRPYCDGTKKDLMCSDLDKCFEPHEDGQKAAGETQTQEENVVHKPAKKKIFGRK